MTYILTFFLPLIGLFASGYIYLKKRQNEKMICLIGKDCDVVVNSKYNNFFGIPNEIIGIFYYFLIIIFFLLTNYFYSLPSVLNLIFIIITLGAAIYSLFLIFIQAFVLKEWCEYCLISAGASIMIFVFKIIPILAFYLKY